MTSRDALAQAGPILYGPVWQSALARALGQYRPDGPLKPVDDRLMRRWAAGDRPIPGWVIQALRDMLSERQQAGAHLLHDIATLIKEGD